MTEVEFGFALSLFFIAYLICEFLSNLALKKVRRAALGRPDHLHLSVATMLTTFAPSATFFQGCGS